MLASGLDAGMVESRRNPHHRCLGGVAERSNAAVLKTAEGASSPWVRIPPPPRKGARIGPRSGPCLGRRAPVLTLYFRSYSLSPSKSRFPPRGRATAGLGFTEVPP